MKAPGSTSSVVEGKSLILVETSGFSGAFAHLAHYPFANLLKVFDLLQQKRKN